MTNFIQLTLPFIGRIYAQRNTVTKPRLAVEVLSSPCGKELLLCCGSLRVYLTPSPVLAAERG